MDKFFFGDESEESEEEKETEKSVEKSIKLDVIKETSEKSYLGIAGTGTGGGAHNFKERRPSHLFITPNPIA